MTSIMLSKGIFEHFIRIDFLWFEKCILKIINYLCLTYSPVNL